MQRIYSEQLLTQEYIRLYTHLANLFFEETKVLSGERGDCTIDVTVEQIETTYVGKGMLEADGRTYTASYEEPIEATWLTPKHQYKRVHSRIVLDLLEQYTGMTQTWGILTGIRPMKLYHRHMQRLNDPLLVRKEMQDHYRIADEKLDLMEHIYRAQLRAIPDLYDLKKEVSLYIGIPFCPTKCAYCTFPAYAIHRKGGRVETFLDALHEEIKSIGAWLKENDVRVTTIYYGGGTPTSIEAEEMDALYETVAASIPSIESVREVTVEAGRPDTITVDKLDVLNRWNIDRISVNPQSYTNETLKAIGRHHTVEETIEKFWLAREHGMNNINMDLIIGLPNEGIEEMAHSLSETEKLQPESVTVHTLSFKRASYMSQNKDKYKVADRATAETMMKMSERWMNRNDYVPYYTYRQKNILGNLENIGYSKVGEESLYNIIIMEEAQTIIGLGSGASSKFVDGTTGRLKQYANPKDPASYAQTYERSIQEKVDWLNRLKEKGNFIGE